MSRTAAERKIADRIRTTCDPLADRHRGFSTFLKFPQEDETAADLAIMWRWFKVGWATRGEHEETRKISSVLD